MKKYALIGLTAIISANSFAELGFGVSVQEHDSVIYLPITPNKRLRLEPYLSYRHTETSTIDSDGYKFSNDFTRLSMGVGIFGKRPIIDSLVLIVGARIGYLTEESDSKSEYSETYLTNHHAAEKSDGYEISPTIGFEYFLIEKFSIGGEFSISYQDLDTESIDREEDIERSKNDGSEETTDTNSRLIARFYF